MTDVASRIFSKRRQRKLSKVLSNHTIIAITTFLSKKYGLLPCFCNYDPLRMMKGCQALTLSKSSNAFWHRKSKSKDKSISEKQQRNNSTSTNTQQTSSTRLSNFKTFRKSLIQRFKRNKKKKLPTITARSIIHKRTNTNTIKQRNTTDLLSITIEPNLDDLLSIQNDSQHVLPDSDPIISQDHSYDNSENDDKNTLEPTASSFTVEQQNINATNNTSQTIQQSTSASQKKHSNSTRNLSSRSTINSSKRNKSNKQKGISKRKTTLLKKRNTTTSKRKNSKASISHTRTKTNVKRKMIQHCSPFPNPNIFHSIPPMENSDEITEHNIHDNHLCCKPITSVKGLSTNDQKKLIEHDYLTLISLLPMYLSSKGNFQKKIREKTNISDDGALELDHLMNKWGSTRLFIGANSHYKELTQTI